MHTERAPLFAHATRCAVVACLATCATAAVAEPQAVAGSGPRLALLWHHASVTAGALAGDGTDVLQRVGRAEPGVEAAWSWSVTERIWIQAVLGLARSSSVPARTYGADTRVEWNSRGSTRSLGLRAGLRFGEVGTRPLWLVLGVAEVERRFDVTLTDTLGTQRQVDRQGQLRIELGVEGVWGSGWHWRAMGGRSRQDFGDRPVDLAGSRPFELSLALVRTWP